MNPTLTDLLCQRRSVRCFAPDAVGEPLLQEVLRIATYAPTGHGKQSPTMVAITNPIILQQLSRLNAQVMGKPDTDPFYGAPAVVAVLGNPEYPTWHEDGCMVMAQLMMAAHAMGLGSCWIHRAREVFALPQGQELLRQWGLPTSLIGIGHCALGFAAGQPRPAAPRKKDYIIRIS